MIAQEERARLARAKKEGDLVIRLPDKQEYEISNSEFNTVNLS